MDEEMSEFLPINMEEARARGWHEVDFVFVSGDAYVDHPSFGAALLARVLEGAGYRVGMLPQPDMTDPAALRVFGRPRLAVLISGGVVDSMVAHYTVAKRRRTFDEYTPGGKTGKRPDRAVEAYAKAARAAWPGVPVIVGGVEASLRRFAHYDYWDDAVRPSILQSSGADMISYGMGERSLTQLAQRLAAGQAIGDITDIPGTAFLAQQNQLPAGYAECAAYAKAKSDKRAYAKACALQMDNQDHLTAKPLVQKQGERYLVQNPPAPPLSREELDEVYALPFTRRWHPVYDDAGGVPALEEVAFSIAHNRGCYGGCAFCAIALHQGRRVTSRSIESVVAEAQRLTRQPGFKGYIHDVGGPTANFRTAACTWQEQHGVCGGGRRCLTPSPCPKLKIDHSEYLALLRAVRAVPGVKKVFIRSGIRYDYLIHDKDEAFFKELVQHHVSGQLKVAPEHCAPAVLRAMGKPPAETYDRFARRFAQLTKQAGKKQYLVPYLLSSHPGSTLKDAVALAQWLHKNNLRPQQVQDFYPTPGTVATCMYHTGLDPYTLKEIYVPRSR
ncbi:YgiQ family radical SAM protein, partial [Ruminococcaceae bacterium OttesenSCG-928-O06]|nr:YgiQ family radical SAM protein [Ruminococcaceae bacterium OttesenSCG-928-O06]